MNGPIAQLAALTCHANAFLAGREIPPFLDRNSTCRFCDRIEFVEIESDGFTEPRRRIVADSPDDWIHDLPIREVDGVRLTFGPRNDPNISDRMSVAFMSGGHAWTMQVVRDDGQTENWSPDWQVWNQQDAERRIWHVTYRLDSTAPSRSRAARNLRIVRSAFRESLREIQAFAEQHTQGAFRRNFDDAMTALDDPDADLGYHKDIAMPGQLGPDAASLLKAAMCAWVFGGMGSWNDMSFEGALQTEYENVSERLFDVIHEAIEASVTSTYLTS